MYNITQYNGKELPKKTLCLTYDDGPGKDTYAIGEFLNTLNIRATFFVVGKYAYHNQDTLKALKKFGHIVANHTYDHPDLPYYVSINGNVQDQVLRTDTLIKEYADNKLLYFRPPYGKWSEEVANELNLNALTSINYVGPIYWEITGIDCYCWRQGFSVDIAIEKYLKDIHKKKDRGIMVMHDEIADMDYLKVDNKTLELTQKLIPLLLEQGYRFIGLDEIPIIKKASEQISTFNLFTSKDKLITVAGSTAHAIAVDKKINDTLGCFSMIKLDNAKVAIKAFNGLYLSSENKDESILATGTDINAHERFDWIPVNHDNFILRSTSGNYITTSNKNGSKLIASAEHMRQAEVFTFKSLDIQTMKDVSLKARFKLLKKRLLFIKSKLAGPDNQD